MPMDDAYTYHQLVSLLYKELSQEQVVQTFDMLRTDNQLRESYASLRAAKAELPQVLFEPSAATIQAILDYSARPMA